MHRLEKYAGSKWPDFETTAAAFSGRPSVFACPAYSKAGGVYYNKENTGFGGGRWVAGAYGYNAGQGLISVSSASFMLFGLGFGPGDWRLSSSSFSPIRESDVVDPAGMIAIGDAEIADHLDLPNGTPPETIGGKFELPDFYSSRLIAGNPDKLPWTSADTAMMRRHRGRWNMLFCDGHVGNGRLKEFFDWQNDEVLKRWNRNHEANRVR
jgi:prepilin-type processing-associated H-X9-DG protein